MKRNAGLRSWLGLHDAGAVVAALAALTLLAANPASAQGRERERRRTEPRAEAAEKKHGREEAPKREPEIPQEVFSTTSHAVEIAGQRIAYTATAGNYLLKEEDGTPKANLFFIAYVKSGEADPARRPVLFSFNGGPGSSSVWLHLGLFGPRRVAMEPEGWAPAPPYRLVDNPHSLLDVTDLVFIDPVTTGYSRAVPGEDDDQFHGVRADIEAVGELIRLWVTRNRRWASPKVLAGESYGTTRAAGLVAHLQERHGMYFNAVILVSSILNFGTARFDPGNDLPPVLFLPTYTATAWYHRRLPADLQAKDLATVLHEVRAFALGPYTLALAKGDRLPAAERREIAEQLARYTGLSPAYVGETDLRIQIFRFVKELLRGERRTVGRLDSRFTGIDRDAAGEGFDFDPSMAAIEGPFSTLLNDYVRRELGYESDLPYEVLTDRVRPWSYDEFENRYVNVAEPLRQAMAQNPALKVLVANGYYDLATPFFATEYTFDHLGLDPSLAGNVEMAYYEAGHMMYIHQPSLEKQRQDLVRFLAKAIPGG
jgi:carboxypeptidase C (cathepsin A)